MSSLYNRLPPVMRRGLPVAVVVVMLFLASVSPASAQQPPQTPTTPTTEPEPPVEIAPTADGLGDCVQGMKVEVLNTGFNALPEDQAVRHGNGGFEAFILMNCKAYEIKWQVVGNDGRDVPGVSSVDKVDEKVDEFQWVDLETVVYERHENDVYDDEGILVHQAGDVVVDADGNAVPLNTQPEPVTVYRFTLNYDNDEATDANGNKYRPLTPSLDYKLRFEIVPFPNAPQNHIFGDVLEIIGKLGGNWWQKLIRTISPVNWIEKGGTAITQGLGTVTMGGMCTVMGNFMTESQTMAWERYDSDRDGQITEADDFVDNHDNPSLPNGNGNCKRPATTPEEQLKLEKEKAVAYANERLIAQGKPPIEPRGTRDTYLSEVLDGRDPRSSDVPIAVQVRYDINHILIAPQMVVDALDEEEEDIIEGGVTTFTGLFIGTPPELTYERGIVRVGWSAMMNVMTAFLVLVIAWTGLRQVVRSFLGSPQSMIEWREAIPRLLLAIMAALTSYWWCSFLVDVADGVSRYVAASMRITPADVTLTLGMALTTLLIREGATSVFKAIPVVGQLLAIVSFGFLTIQLMLMKTFAITVLMVAAQFVMRIALINLLIMISPLAMLLWALPETSGWGRRWLSIFATTLFQHGLQLVMFAFGLWSVRSATVIGAVTDSGSLNTLTQSLLPTQMLWALVLGIFAMIVTFKIPSMLGQGGLQESFVATISLAAGGFQSLMGGASGVVSSITGQGGPGSPLAAMASGGDGGGAAASAQGVASTATNYAMGAAAAGLGSVWNMGKHIISGRGAVSDIGQAIGNTDVANGISGGAPSMSSSQGFSGFQAGAEGGFDAGAEGSFQGGAEGGVQPGVDMGEGGGVDPSTGVAGFDDSGGFSDPMGGQPQGGFQAATGDIGADAGVGTEAGVGADLGVPPAAAPGAPPQAAPGVPPAAAPGAAPTSSQPITPRAQYDADERMVGRSLHRGGLDGLRSSSGHYESDQQRMSDTLGSAGLQNLRSTKAQAFSPHQVMENDTIRPATQTESAQIDELGVDGYNRVMDQRASGGIRSLDQHVRDGDTIRPATQDEQNLITDMGGADNFNQAMQSDEPAFEALSSQEVRVGENIRPTTEDEQRLISGMGVDGFNQGMEQDPSSEVRAISPTEVMDGGTVRPATDSEREIIEGIGADRFNQLIENDQPSGITAFSANEVQDGDTIRPATEDEERLMSRFGTDGFNQMMEADSSVNIRSLGHDIQDGEGIRSATQQESALIDQMGTERFNRVAAEEPIVGAQAINANEMNDGGTVRPTTREERALIDRLGTHRFNQVMDQVRPGPQAGDNLTFGERMRTLPTAGIEGGIRTFEGYMESGTVQVARDASGQTRALTSQENLAKKELGNSEYWESAGKDISYAGQGSFVNTGDRVRLLNANETFARDTLGDDEFMRDMNSSLRVTSRQQDGSYTISDNGQERLSTDREQRLIDGMGTRDFNNTFGARNAFMGDGTVVRDNGAIRMATEGETNLFNRVGSPERFNEVMRPRTQYAGTVARGLNTMDWRTAGQQMREDFTQGREYAEAGYSAIRERGARAASRGRDISSSGADAARGAAGGINDAARRVFGRLRSFREMPS